MGVYIGKTEITNIDNLVPQTMQDITQAFFGSTEVFTVWGEYDGTLPAQYSANGGYLADYRIYGSAGGVGDYVAPEYKQVHTDTVTIDGIVWDILGYDHDTVYKSDSTLAQHSVTIQAHDVLSEMQFDAKEALFAFDNGLAAGTYHFTVGAQPWYSSDVGKTIQFTLTQAIPAGGQLVINNNYNVTMVGATISAFASGTATTATETVTMSEGNDGTDLGTVSNGLSQDGIINSIQRSFLGYGNWEKSAMRQYLNSSVSVGSVWEPKHKWDRPPTWAANTAGFLNGLSADFIANLGTTSKTTALNRVTDGGGAGTTLDKVFLLSRSELYAGDETTGGEGAAYSYYSDFSDLSAPGAGADSNRIKYRDGSAVYWWSRSPYVGNVINVFSVLTTGALNGNFNATNGFGVAPACCIVLDDIDTNDWLREKFLKNPRAAFSYEVDMSVSDGTTTTTTPIYIGSSPLEEDEYIDYESGKIYRKKQVHTDTVTIDGIVWDILGYDHDTVYKSDNTLAQHSVTIQAHDVLSDMQFDAKEALFAFDNGFAAGTYHFTVGAQPWYASDIGKTIQFTLTQAIPAGGQLVINNNYYVTMVGATISAFASGTATTATETITMSEGSDGTDLGTVTTELSQDGVINSIQRALRGSNRWSTSDIRQYLNSDAAAGEAWTPQTPFDRSPSWAASTAGFLNGLDPEFVAVLGSVKKVTALNTVSDGGGKETTTEKMFLLSQSEVFGGDIITGGEDSPYEYYSDYSDYQSPNAGADSNRIKYRNGAAKYWWLRSPYAGHASTVRSVAPSGTVYVDYVTISYGVAPACCIVLDDMETNNWLREKFLKPVDPPVPLPALPTVDGTTITNYAGQSAAVPSRFTAKYRKQNF